MKKNKNLILKYKCFTPALLSAALICFLVIGLLNEVSFASAKTTVTLRVKSARVREKPSLKADVEAGLKKGDTVTLIKTKGNWYNIRLKDGRIGWAHKSLFLKPVRSYKADTTETKKPEKIHDDIATAKEKPVAKKADETRTDIKPEKEKPEELKETRDNITAEEKKTVAREAEKTEPVKEKPGTEELKEALTSTTEKEKPVKKIEKPEIKPEKEKPEQEEKKLASKAPEKEKTVAKKVKETRKKRPGYKEVINIRYDTTAEGKERVIFELSGFYPPETFVLEEGAPKIVCDFLGARASRGLKKRIRVNSKLIRQIRIGIHGGAKRKVRAVLDLVPDKYYDVEQQFYKEENFYVLIVESSGNN